jgi:hypothetical protein
MAGELGSPGWLLVAWLTTGALTVRAALTRIAAASDKNKKNVLGH